MTFYLLPNDMRPKHTIPISYPLMAIIFIAVFTSISNLDLQLTVSEPFFESCQLSQNHVLSPLIKKKNNLSFVLG